MSDGKTQVLNLDAELKRAEITYQGATYQLRNRSELSILEAHLFSELLKGHTEMTGEELDEEKAERVGETLQQIAATLVVDPPKDGFPDQMCAAILSFWTDQQADAVPPPRRRQPQDRKPKQKRSTGARSSRA